MTHEPDIEHISGELIEDDKTFQYKNNPYVVVIIRNIALTHLDMHPDASDISTFVFLATKSVLTHSLMRTRNTSAAPAIFTYYLEVYARIYALRQEQDETQYGLYYAQAALSIFDLYVEDVSSLIRRRLLSMAAPALHQSIIANLAANPSNDPKALMSPLSNIALLTQTVTRYISGAHRVKNIPYIKWLKQFLEQIKDKDTLDPFDEDSTFKRVINQVYNNKSLIKIPE